MSDVLFWIPTYMDAPENENISAEKRVGAMDDWEGAKRVTENCMQRERIEYIYI